MESRAGYGRVCVASRDISRHQLVLDDDPVGLSPTQDSPPICLTCLTPLDGSSWYLCDCGFPLCSSSCSSSEQHRPEHQVFTRSGVVARGARDYPLVMPIRLLTALEAGNDTLRDRVGRLMDHNQEREREEEGWQWVEERVVRPLLRLETSWTREEIQRCVGLFRTNACTTQLPPSGEAEAGQVRVLYPSMAILSHSCSPNTQARYRPDHGLSMTATRDIRRGEEITNTYTTLWGSSVHRKKDFANWFFDCSCERCEDGEDLGSELDSWKCWQSSCRGVLSLSFCQLWPDIPAFPSWQCNLCHHSATADDIKRRESSLVSSLQVMGQHGGSSTICFISSFSEN